MNRAKRVPDDKPGLGPSPRSNPKVCVVDDEPAVLRSIESALAILKADVECYESAEQFLADYRPGDVACLLLDYILPGASGLELLEHLKDDASVQVVMISGRGSISTAVSAMKSGAIEFLEKPYSVEDLCAAVQNAIERHRWYMSTQADRQARQDRLQRLSDGERKVIEASATGETVKEIASQLDISVRTVHMRLSSAMKKTGASNKIELIKLLYLANSAPNQPH